jgi:hypothetical protein
VGVSAPAGPDTDTTIAAAIVENLSDRERKRAQHPVFEAEYGMALAVQEQMPS